MRQKKKVRGFEANGCRNACKEAIHGTGKGGSEEEAWGKKGEKGRVGGTGGGG